MINIFIIITYIFSLLESILYRGFFWKHLLIDPVFLMSVVLTYMIIVDKKFYLSKLLFIFSFFIYVVLILVDSFKYNNFVFSNFHIQPGNFLYLVIFSLMLFLRGILYTKLNNNDALIKVSLLIFCYLFIVNITTSTHQAMTNVGYMIFHSNYSYSDKMSHFWGFFYDYMSFVKMNSEDDSVVMIPPQVSPWLSSGNTSLVRYFLYPRKIVQGDINFTGDQDGVDYVLISYGEWPENDKNKYGWPKNLNSYKSIIYMNNTDKKWGLIKLKK